MADADGADAAHTETAHVAQADGPDATDTEAADMTNPDAAHTTDAEAADMTDAEAADAAYAEAADVAGEVCCAKACAAEVGGPEVRRPEVCAVRARRRRAARQRQDGYRRKTHLEWRKSKPEHDALLRGDRCPKIRANSLAGSRRDLGKNASVYPDIFILCSATFASVIFPLRASTHK